MTLAYLSGNRINGIASDTKPSNIATNSTFFETDTDKTFDWNGSAWVERLIPSSSIADGTIANVDVNSSAGITVSKLEAGTKGDILASTGSNFTKTNIGSNDQVLTADSAQATGLKWATASAGGQLELLATVALGSANSSLVLLSSASIADTAYNEFIIYLKGGCDGDFVNPIGLEVNDITSQYHWTGHRNIAGTVTNFGVILQSSAQLATTTTMMNAGEEFYSKIYISIKDIDEAVIFLDIWTYRGGDRNVEYKHVNCSSGISALTALDFTCASGKMIAGTTAWLYGVKT